MTVGGCRLVSKRDFSEWDREDTPARLATWWHDRRGRGGSIGRHGGQGIAASRALCDGSASSRPKGPTMANIDRITALLGLAALTLAGCARERAGTPPPVVARSPRPAPAPAFAPAAYVAAAASIDLFAIRASELAMQRPSGPRYRDFATMLIAAHRGTSAQLSFAGRRLNLLPSATLLPRHQAMLAELETSSDFAATYKRLQIVAHQEALRLHAGFAARGNSPTLRPVATAAAQIMRRHLTALRAL